MPAAPPNCTASLVVAIRFRSCLASSIAVSQPAATRPKVTGTACWSKVRPDMTVPVCWPASVAQASAAAARSAWVACSDRRATSIAAVSMMSWLVAPRWMALAASA